MNPIIITRKTMFSKKDEFEYLDAWRLLFETEGSYTGITRDVFDQSIDRLVHQLLGHFNLFHRTSDGLAGQAVRELMKARLPLEGSSKEKMRTMYTAINTGAKLPAYMDGAFAYACQTFRLPNVTTDKLREELF
jgi:hypothetical protein